MKRNLTPTIQIAGRSIGPKHPPYVIAELSANHNGDLGTALRIIDVAKKAGADAVKLQTYRPDTITLDSTSPDFMIRGGLWDGKSLYELYQWAHMPWDWHKPLFEHARRQEITIFSSPFDFSAVDLLEDLNAPAYKIASFEAVDLPLIKYAASTKKPLVISTGMASKDEIAEAIDAARSAGCRELAILHCVSGYPALAEHYNLRTIGNMIDHFGVVVGLSDHTIDNTTAVASVALGASIIEKHVTLDRKGGGPDDSFSLEPDGLVALTTEARRCWSALGDVTYQLQESEAPNQKFRRSLYIVKSIAAGEEFSPENVRSVRPGYGLAPKHYHALIGRVASRDFAAGEPVPRDILIVGDSAE
ncbi:pseudaminic acid synthase [Caballeronia glebae]|uniref:Pseudaminic acid synthase n=1 Tax=Caballeronia glebae TaxID=1777143 RepID=A0A158C7F6_9BURK|nr:pseudaminic acid synthase [Caballeronia glebae]SAK77457.1 Pseudaminic acid synthase [Caballeronia glebae]